MGRAGYALDRTAFDPHVTPETQARCVVISNAVRTFHWAQIEIRTVFVILMSLPYALAKLAGIFQEMMYTSGYGR